MPFFRKREPSPPDDVLPLTTEQAALLRRLVRERFAVRGREVAVEPDHVRDDAGAQYGLWNLAVLCSEAPERDWPSLVDRHVAHLVEGRNVEDLPEAELAENAVLRLQPEESLGLGRVEVAAAGVAPGLVAAVAIDMPTEVVTPNAAFWAARGGFQRWSDIGRGNLARLIGGSDLEHARLAQDEVGFSVLLGDSFFTASLGLLLPEVMRTYGTDVDQGDGVLVAVPNRHQLVWRSIDGPGVIPTINAMFQFALSGFNEGAGPVSPHLYWVRDGVWDRISSLEGDQPTVEVRPDLAEVLERLAR